MTTYKAKQYTFVLLLVICTFLLFSGLSSAANEESSPFVFHDEDFTTLLNSSQGNFKLLKKFTERSEYFRGIENIRIFIFEGYTQSFVTPTYFDSDIVFFVGHGRGTVTLVFEDGVKSFNIERGHLMTITAGNVFYLINRDDQEKLILYGFVQPIANPGNFAPFFTIGSQSTSETFYNVFSPEILETFFNTSSDKVKTLFSKQNKGVILKASKDQIKALTVEENGSSCCLKEYGPCQIFDHHVTANEFGRISSVTPKDYLSYVDLNMYTSFSITYEGCMNSPLYSTRATKVIMVVNGSGRVEIAAPYHEEGSTEIRYKKITTQLKRGMVFVVPPGYPLVLLASKNENLETLNLEFFAKGNSRHLLGGRNNILKLLPKEAKELAFGTSVEEVDAVLNSQHLDDFMKGPSQPNRQDAAAF